MRAVKMNKRSVYWGLPCIHCHKPIRVSQVALCSTYYVTPKAQRVSTQSNVGSWGLFRDTPVEEFGFRIAYHRRCIEKILRKAPVDAEIEAAEFEAYRQSLVERFDPGSADE